MGYRLVNLDPALPVGWTPLERHRPSAWADRYRLLQSQYSAEPGPWRTLRTPYLGGVMDAFADHGCDMITFVKSARVGGTEAINNMIGFAIDQSPGPMLYCYPDEKAAREECKDRIGPFIEASPRLGQHIPHQGWNTQIELTLDSCRIYMAWAASQTTLIRRTIRYAFVDEIDNCDRQAGPLGDTVALVRKRTTTFQDRGKVVLASTPTTPRAGAWRTWLGSDKRMFHVPCPKCGVYQVIEFDRLRVPEGQRDPDVILHDELAWYGCAACDAKLIDRDHKMWMVERGVWVPSCQSIAENLNIANKDRVARAIVNHPNRWTPRLNGSPPITKTRGFHIWAAYSPWVTWSQIMAEWFSVKDEPEKAKVFRNSVLGLPWEIVIQTTGPAVLWEKVRTGLARGEQAPAVMQLVGGVDVQADRLYWSLVAWGPLRESWLVDHGVLYAIEDDIIPAMLDRLYTQLVMSQGSLRVKLSLVLVDSGYASRDVYEFCHAHPGFSPCKGDPKQQSHIVRAGNIEPKRGKKKSAADIHRQLWLVNTDACKDHLHAWAGRSGGGPSTMNLHREVDEAWIKQFTAEHKIIEKGREVWRPKTAGRDNHYLDTVVYALGAAELTQALQLQPPPGTTPPPETRRDRGRPKYGRGPMGYQQKRRGR